MLRDYLKVRKVKEAKLPKDLSLIEEKGQAEV